MRFGTLFSPLLVSLILLRCDLLSAQRLSSPTTAELSLTTNKVSPSRSTATPARDTAGPNSPSSRDAILNLAQDGYERIRDIRDYSCLLVKRERVEGKLGDYQFMQAKVRHARDVDGREVPFSVYLKFLAPDDLSGREVLYVAGANEGKIIAKKGGLRFSYITTEVDPLSDLAMRDNRYPITEFGFENLVRRFLERLDSGSLENCSIQMLQGSKVDGRSCRAIQVTQNSRTADADFYVARVYIDEELQIPIHYEAYDWPPAAGGKPRLLEQYTYRQVKLNVGLSDADFQRDNPSYGFSD